MSEKIVFDCENQRYPIRDGECSLEVKKKGIFVPVETLKESNSCVVSVKREDKNVVIVDVNAYEGKKFSDEYPEGMFVKIPRKDKISGINIGEDEDVTLLLMGGEDEKSIEVFVETFSLKGFFRREKIERRLKAVPISDWVMLGLGSIVAIIIGLLLAL